MNLKFEIKGICSVPGADYKPKEDEIADAIETVLEDSLGLISIICVDNMREEK